jgi:hypothetical protein
MSKAVILRISKSFNSLALDRRSEIVDSDNYKYRDIRRYKKLDIGNKGTEK